MTSINSQSQLIFLKTIEKVQEKRKYREKNICSTFTQLSIKGGTYGQVRSYLVSL